MFGELLGPGLACELPVDGLCPLVDNLEVAEFVEEDLVEHESTHGEHGPLAAANRPEPSRRLAPQQEAAETDPRRDRPKADLIHPQCDVAKAMAPHPPVVKVNCREPVPQVTRQAFEDDADILFCDEVPPAASRPMIAEGQWPHGAGWFPYEHERGSLISEVNCTALAIVNSKKQTSRWQTLHQASERTSGELTPDRAHRFICVPVKIGAIARATSGVRVRVVPQT